MRSSGSRFVLPFRWLIVLSLWTGWAWTPARADSAPVFNVRDFGAVGDGRVHLVGEWIAAGRFSSLRALQQKYPFVDGPGWSLDEVAFAAAKRALPVAGGTIHFPAGHYVAAKYPWRIWRDHVSLTGDGADHTILATAPGVEEGLVLAPYRHAGWVQGAAREFPFATASGRRGDVALQLGAAAWTQAFHPGEIVFIRNGANRFDQDFGEFNEIATTTAAGQLVFKYPFARDYTAAGFNWAGETAADFTLPARGSAVRVKLRQGEGYFVPTVNSVISIGENLFRVERVGPARGVLLLANDGRANAPRGTVVAAGTPVGKSRAVLRVTRTVRGFRCTGLQIVGRRKALNLSNSYDSVFTDCVFVRDASAGGVNGGLTIDGDGGRFARFERCRVVGLPGCGMQFARSFGSVTFSECRFVDTNVAFTEFAFDGKVSRCTFEVHGGPNLSQAIIAGKSCGGLRFLDNYIRATGVARVFDTVADIHSQKKDDGGVTLIRGNTVAVDEAAVVFDHGAPTVARTDNRIVAR